MPLVPISRDFLDVDVSDRTPGLKQRARWFTMFAKQDLLTGQVSVQLQVQVNQYLADEQGGYGEPVAGKGIQSYTVPLIADNNSAVNPDTGEVLYMRSTETEQEWLALLEAKPEPLLLQGDWFDGLMEKMGIKPLIRQFMAQADHPPFNKFN